MIVLAKFLQLFGLTLLPGALIVGFSTVRRAGEIELMILVAGIVSFGLGRMVEKRISR